MRRTKRTSILIGIPRYQTDKSFLLSLSRFLTQIENHYRVEIMEVNEKSLVEAQNIIADYFVKSSHTHLLFLEDDHSGHERKMLQALFRADTDICSINYYARHWPFYECLMKDLYPDKPYNRFGMTGFKSGYHQVDLSGFAMMLIKREVFDRLEKPYFRLNKYGGQGSYATDIDFCDRCRESGIAIVGCFDYILNHRQVNPQNVEQLRLEGFDKVKQERQQYLKEKGYV